MLKITPTVVLIWASLLLIGCGADGNEAWDGVNFPAPQGEAELAFRRMARNGDLEPVLTVAQPVRGWVFRIERSTADSIYLADRSGIDYRSRKPAGFPSLSPADDRLWIVQGQVEALDRNYPDRRISVTLDIDSISQLVRPN